ncbi:unnamed protein product [Porites lobata]|uniref:PH domain-containing protein n=1 Tax=Porites lobata TaxID=104759 RepID=A0ABN8NYF1_9CNID|nr:unnamed protein product [Porites lobata]
MAKAVENFANISATDLLSTAPSLFGWLRKDDGGTGLLSVVKKIDGWSWFYMILKTGYLYLFKKPDSTNFTEAISLENYKVCHAQEVTKYPWVFKLISSTEVKTLFFSVDTEYDLKKWMDAIVKEKEEYINPTSHAYCDIDYPPPADSQRSPPPPPSTSRRLPERPPARLPDEPSSRRPYSLSLPPEPSEKYSQQSKPLPPPPKQNSPVNKKPATLPRPEAPGARGGKLGHLTKARRSFSESQLGVQQSGATFDSVVKQLGKQGNRLGHIQETVPALPRSPRPAASNPLRPNTHGRCPPDGCENAKVKQVEVSQAFNGDADKETASRLLKQELLGTYLTRPGNSESGKSLSVRDMNEDGTSLIRHYRIFFKEGVGYSLDNRIGPWFAEISQVLGHYYKHQLPNSENKLRSPYQR